MYRIVSVICSVFITATSILGAAFVPTLPFVPPADVQILGLINNIYGMTAISESSETDKLEAYWNMYRAIMGSAFDTFKAQMQEVLDGAKTSRKIVITPQLNNIINQALKEGVQNGINVGTQQTAAVNPQEWVDRLAEKGITMTLAQATELKTKIGNNYAGATSLPYTLGVMVGSKQAWGDNKIAFLAYYVGIEPYFMLDPNNNRDYMLVYGTPANYTIMRNIVVYNIDYSNMTVTSFQGTHNAKSNMNIYQDYKFLLGAQQQKTQISSMSNSASANIAAKEQIPLTASTEIVDGVLDDTKNIVVDLPNVTPYPAIDPQQIAEVLRELGVVPVSETTDIAQTVEELKEESIAKYGDANEYTLDLTRYFPFCLPFDIYRILAALVAEPEAPSFTYTIDNPFSENAEDDIVLEIDLSVFEGLAAVLRTLETIMFVLGLAVVTRTLYLRG